jgi:hypothetical protein
MHFIDTVFPLQYPMYRPNIVEGGRGWLLSLLLSTKPLYHASLALSAYHRGTVLLAASHRAGSTSSTVSQERHLAICLSEFQQAIKNVSHWVSKTCPSNSLGLMACVLQLLFFEVCPSWLDAGRFIDKFCSFSQATVMHGRYTFEPPLISSAKAIGIKQWSSVWWTRRRSSLMVRQRW